MQPRSALAGLVLAAVGIALLFLVSPVDDTDAAHVDPHGPEAHADAHGSDAHGSDAHGSGDPSEAHVRRPELDALLEGAVDLTLVGKHTEIAELDRAATDDGDAALKVIADDEAHREIVRVWAAASLTRRAPDLDSLWALRHYAERHEAVRPMFGDRTRAFAADAPLSRRLELFQSCTEWCAGGVLGEMLVTTPGDELLTQLLEGTTSEVRQKAAGIYGAAASRVGHDTAAENVIVRLRHDPEGFIPWAGGPLWLPTLNWSQPHRQELAAELQMWATTAAARGDQASMNQANNGIATLTGRRPDPFGGLGILSAGCDPLTPLEPAAMMGKLNAGQIACVEARVRNTADNDRVGSSRVLMTNAFSKGDKTAWEGLIKRHLTTLESDDPDLSYRYALHLSRKGPAGAAECMKWSQVALDHSEMWEDNTFASRVYSLHKLRAASAQKLWKQAEDAQTPDSAAEFKALTLTEATAWVTFGHQVGKDTTKAAQLCVAAGGTPEQCTP